MSFESDYNDFLGNSVCQDPVYISLIKFAHQKKQHTERVEKLLCEQVDILPHNKLRSIGTWLAYYCYAVRKSRWTDMESIIFGGDVPHSYEYIRNFMPKMERIPGFEVGAFRQYHLQVLVQYAVSYVGTEWKELETYILAQGAYNSALSYAALAKKARWEQLEEIVLSPRTWTPDPHRIVDYCILGRKERWRDIEPLISLSVEWDRYKNRFIGRMPTKIHRNKQLYFKLKRFGLLRE